MLCFLAWLLPPLRVSKFAEVGGRSGRDPPKRVGAGVPVAAGHLKNAGRERQGLVAGILPLADST